jgi:hypothetical protein
MVFGIRTDLAILRVFEGGTAPVDESRLPDGGPESNGRLESSVLFESSEATPELLDVDLAPGEALFQDPSAGRSSPAS